MTLVRTKMGLPLATCISALTVTACQVPPGEVTVEHVASVDVLGTVGRRSGEPYLRPS